MIEDPARAAVFIGREFIFRGLSRDQLLMLADLFDSITLVKDEIFTTPKKLVEAFYIIYDGKLQVEYPARRKKAFVSVLEFGDYFGEEVLYKDEPPPVTITALEDTVLLMLTPANFELLAESMPEQVEEIVKALKITANSRSTARTIRFKWLKENESVFFISRKHYFFLLRALILPILLFVFSFPIITIGITNSGSGSGINVVLLIGISMLIMGIFGVIWSWLDWSNDYYVVTEERVVWVEKIFLMYDSRDEATLMNILATEVVTTWLGRVLDFGDAVARTFTGKIPMRKTSQPYILAAIIDRLRFRAQEVQEELQEKETEQALAEALKRRRNPATAVNIPEARRTRAIAAPKKKPAARPTGLRASLLNIFHVRYEQDGVITYRKFWLVFIRKSWVPLLLLALYLWFVSTQLFGGSGDINSTWMCFLGGIGILILLWLVYNFQDWRNDKYLLTPTQIFDIEKKPLGTEIKHSADLANILTITHERRNIINIIFNYGNVLITVGQTLFTFMGVWNPDRVHQDIENYQNALKMRQQQVEQAKERERMIHWLVAYYSETQDEVK